MEDLSDTMPHSDLVISHSAEIAEQIVGNEVKARAKEILGDGDLNHAADFLYASMLLPLVRFERFTMPDALGVDYHEHMV